MCELLAMSSSVPERLNLSLQLLASHGDEQHGTNDGWGVAYYQDRDVALFREPQGAGNSPLLEFLRENGPETNIAISHIRRATIGARLLANTQPFVRAMAGRMHTFAHNGNLVQITKNHDASFSGCVFQPIGETDSEQAFSYLLSLLQQSPQQATSTVEQRAQVFRQFCAEMRRLGPANFIYSDGEFVFVHAHRRIQRESGMIAPPGFWMLERHCLNLNSSVDVENRKTSRDVILVASVPLTQEAWIPLAEAELLILHKGKRLSI